MRRNERERKESYSGEGRKREGSEKLKVYALMRYEIRELFDSGALLMYYRFEFAIEEHLAKLNKKLNNILILNFLVRLD